MLRIHRQYIRGCFMLSKVKKQNRRQLRPDLFTVLNLFQFKIPSPKLSAEEERQMLARQRYLQEKKRMIILDESRAEEQARKEAGLARIEKVAGALANLARAPELLYATLYAGWQGDVRPSKLTTRWAGTNPPERLPRRYRNSFVR